MASAPRPATTYMPNLDEHGQFYTGSTQSYHRSATLPAPQSFPPPAPSAVLREGASVYEVQRQPIHAQHMLPPSASMPPLEAFVQTPLGMSTPPALQLPTPFELPPAGQVLGRPETPLRNPYDDLYARLELDVALTSESGLRSSTPPLARSLSPATTVRSRSSSGPSAAMLASASSPISVPTPTTAALGLTEAITGSSGPAVSTAAASAAGTGTSAASAPDPPRAEATKSESARALTSARATRWGPNEYPPEKREVRLEPPADASASSSSLVREDLADCPPAYTS
ncbi:hypothetical protein V8D89_003387 [Ganoderma adspersum]